MVLSRLAAVTGFSRLLGMVKAGQDLSRGWGTHIEWLPLDEAQQVAREYKKPMMVIVHKETCPVCAELKPKFAGHPGIRNLSQKFVMVNLTPDEVPKDDDTFYPDGSYVPRIMFFNCDCSRMDIESDEKRHRYFYKNTSLIEINMRIALEESRV